MTSSSSNKPARSGAAAAWTIRAVVFAAFIDLYMQLPVIATFAASLGASATMAGVIAGAYSAANMLGNLAAGLLLDMTRRKRVVIVGMALTAAALFAYAYVSSHAALLGLRVAHGLAAGALTPGAFAMLGDRARAGHAQTMGATGSLIAIAAIVGFPLSAVIQGMGGYEWVFRASGLMMLCAMVAFAILARDETPASAPSQDAQDDAQAAPRSPLRDGYLLMVYAIVLAMTYCIGALIGYLPIAIESAGFADAPRWSGAAFTAFALVAALIMATPAQRRLDAKSRGLAIALGLALICASGAGLALSALGGGSALALALMVGMMGAFGLGFGFLFPSLGAAVSERGGGRRGMAFGVFYAIYSLGVFIGSGASGAASDALGAVAPFAISAAIAALALPIAAALRGR